MSVAIGTPCTVKWSTLVLAWTCDVICDASKGDSDTVGQRYWMASSAIYRTGPARYKVLSAALYHAIDSPGYSIWLPAPHLSLLVASSTLLFKMSSYEYKQYFVPGYQISRHIIFSHIQIYLGPYATVRPYSYRGREGYLVTAPGLPLTRVRSVFLSGEWCSEDLSFVVDGPFHPQYRTNWVISRYSPTFTILHASPWTMFL